MAYNNNTRCPNENLVPHIIALYFAMFTSQMTMADLNQTEAQKSEAGMTRRRSWSEMDRLVWREGETAVNGGSMRSRTRVTCDDITVNRLHCQPFMIQEKEKNKVCYKITK